MEHWVNLRFILYKNKGIDNPSENADMSNEKGNVRVIIDKNIISNMPRLKLMVFIK